MSKITEENIKEKFEDLVTDLNKLSKFCKDNKISWTIDGGLGVLIGCFAQEYALSKLTKTVNL